MKPELEYLMNLQVDLGEILSLGDTPKGERRVVSILGGTFEGPRLNGEVLSGGADWQIARTDDVLEIDAQYTLRENSGGLIRIVSQGYRHGPPEILAAIANDEEVNPDDYFFRTIMRFETGASDLSWLNRTIAIAKGSRKQLQVLLEAYELL